MMNHSTTVVHRLFSIQTDRIVREVESAKKRILCDYSTQTEKEQAFPAVEMLGGRLCVYVDQREKNTDAAACSSLMP